MRARHLERYGNEDIAESDEGDELSDEVPTLGSNSPSRYVNFSLKSRAMTFLVFVGGSLYFDTFYWDTPFSIGYAVPADSLINDQFDIITPVNRPKV